MKYGLLWYKDTQNIGDDIQTYAALQFLPKIDYMVDRESISNFKSKKGEPVAVIMNAWWMWKKWNWPPSKYIIPKLISMHITDWTIENWGSSIKYEILEGIGKAYLNSYGPVGARDTETLKILKKYKIESYFSGCLTLTLPKQKIKRNSKKYICLVDVDVQITNYVNSKIKGQNIELKKMTHNLSEKNIDLNWNQRKKNVEKLLIIYQNAQLIITNRLHVALPCLAMDVPVLLIRDDFDNGRFNPYIDLVNYVTKTQFLNNEYDILKPLNNKKDYLKIRNYLIQDVKKFIQDMENSTDKNLNDIIKIKYTEDDRKDWQLNLMKNALDKWFYESRNMLREYNKTINYLRTIEKENFDIKKSTSWKITRPLRIIKYKIEKLLKK